VFGGFARLAVLVSVVGVAGVLAFSVSGRTREFGIRMALGAQPGSILAKVLGEGVVIAVLGVVAGGLAGLVLARVVGGYVAEAQLPGMLPLALSAAVIVAAATIAAAIPAIRAARVNPVEALLSD
jgi:ABC-type antimicrobial peptide transport system permease subunit